MADFSTFVGFYELKIDPIAVLHLLQNTYIPVLVHTLIVKTAKNENQNFENSSFLYHLIKYKQELLLILTIAFREVTHACICNLNRCKY